MKEHAIVKLDQVSKYYQEGASRRLVLDRVSAELRSGELVVIQGRSGSGKTTLLNLIAGLDVPDAGAVMVDGKAIHALTEHERTLFRRRHLGFVFQFFNLVGTLTVAENMRFSLDLNGFPAAETQARVEALLQDMGIAATSHASAS